MNNPNEYRGRAWITLDELNYRQMNRVFGMVAACPECRAEAVHPVLTFEDGRTEQRCINARCGHQWPMNIDEPQPRLP